MEMKREKLTREERLDQGEMTEVSNAVFFRPWKADETGKSGDQVEKCEKRDFDMDDTSSVPSPWSESNQSGSETPQDFKENLIPESRIKRIRIYSDSNGSSDESSSTFYKYGHQNEADEICKKMDSDRMARERELNYDPVNSISAFSPPAHGVHPGANYPSHPFLHSIVPNWPATHSALLNLHGFGSVPIPDFGVEEAVKYLHQQDVAAKQLKKMRPKKFRCHHCDVAFSNNGQLKGHIRIHTGERPFKCEIDGCNKAFTRNEELTRHKKIHTGLKPHSCDACGKSFGRKDHLKKHQRTHQNRGLPGHFGAPMFRFIEHPGHFQPLPTVHPFPPYQYAI